MPVEAPSDNLALSNRAQDHIDPSFLFPTEAREAAHTGGAGGPATSNSDYVTSDADIWVLLFCLRQSCLISGRSEQLAKNNSVGSIISASVAHAVGALLSADRALREAPHAVMCVIV